ncbi:phage portal protein [Vibrio parahaemolyticus]|uniref:phage portal protein n=1 Tax=Vibrio parahaemolyticus TaxID=670 RepID=UPI001124537B|nr:phage portal protein [Vibrio parahaemolyticus]TOQ04193.1 phage portal protein [Vibrio parahaemolyticus]TOR20619.1 phage portal protein [Vibrio parahaemolyticus]
MWNPFNRNAKPEAKKKRRKTPFVKLSPVSRSLFSAADPDRNNSTWDSSPVPIGKVIDQKLAVLVARSREQISNNDYARGFVREVRKNVLGHKGIVLQVRGKEPDGSLDTNGNAAVEKAFKKWGRRENCTVDGRLDWRRAKRVILNTVVGSGEAFIRIVEGPHAGPWGFAIQLIDPLRVPIQVNESRLANGNVIRNGIEMTPYGRLVAYLVETKAGVLAEAFRHGGKEFERVSAEDMLHVYDQEHPEQFRGIPWNHTSLSRMRNLSGFEEASVVNARAGASKTLVLQADADVYEPDESEEFEEPEIELEPNTVVTLPPGFTPVDYSPDFPSTETATFSKHMLRGMATGQGMAYNTYANDLEGVNLSSIRQGKLDERDGWKELQEWFIESVCHRVYERWLQYSLLAGKVINSNGNPIPASRLGKFLDADWQPRRWEWIDPLKEEKAITEAQENGRKSPGEAIRESGREPVDVWKGYAEDIKAMRAEGIPDEMIAQILGIKATGQPVGVNQSEQEDDETDDE